MSCRTTDKEHKHSETILSYAVTSRPRAELIARIGHWITERRGSCFLACANPHSLEVAREDATFSRALMNADILVPDGVGIVIASKILGGAINERITGSDVFLDLSAMLDHDAAQKRRYFFLGSSEQTLDKIKQKMSADFPNIAVCGTYSPPFRDVFSEEENRLMVEAVNSASPDVLWVGMTAPKQEKWIYQNREHLQVSFIGAIGAVFDFFTGNVRRSHPVFQKLGLEWLPRLLREPLRLWRRNFISNPRFLLRVLHARFFSRKLL